MIVLVSFVVDSKLNSKRQARDCVFSNRSYSLVYPILYHFNVLFDMQISHFPIYFPISSLLIGIYFIIARCSVLFLEPPIFGW